MAELIRQHVLRRADALAGRDGDDPRRLETMLKYYSPLNAVRTRGRAQGATKA